jgi:hypothetical protein
MSMMAGACKVISNLLCWKQFVKKVDAVRKRAFRCLGYRSMAPLASGNTACGRR